MAPGSRTSSPGRVYPDHNTKTQPRSPTKNEDSVDCYPWDSRGRRLFPQRRPSIPTSVSRNVNATPCFSILEPFPSDDHSAVEHEGVDRKISRSSSVNSVGTIKIHKSPTSTRPYPKTDPRFGGNARARMAYLAGSLPVSASVQTPITSHKSSDKCLENSFSAPLYTDAPARGNLQWKSMARFHKSRHRLRPRILTQLPNGEQPSQISDKSDDPLAPEKDAFKGSIPLETGPCRWSQSLEILANPRLLPNEVCRDNGREEDIHVVDKDYSRPCVPALSIATWDCTVKLSTVAKVDGNGLLHVHHLAVLTVLLSTKIFYAEKISLSFMVANALRTDHRCSLGLGQSSLLFKEDVSQPGFFPREGVELVIVRDSCDLEKPLHLYFSFTYRSPWHFVMASLPTFRPKQGRSLSEAVFIAEPLPPLSMKTYTRDPLSSWKLCHHPVNQVTCYERINFPRLYPECFQDDIQIRILELGPVRFRALGQSALSKVIWKLDIVVLKISEGQIDYRMSFFVDVGAATAVVSLIPHGWVPQYFIIGGCVATEMAEECWKNEEGHITIFKKPHMGLGPVLIETHWRGPPKHGKQDGYSTDDLYLPGVAERKVLGGRLTCQAQEITLLNHVGKRVHSYGSIDGTSTELPTLDAGYRFLLKRVIETPAQKFRRLVVACPPVLPSPDNNQRSEHMDMKSDTKVEKAHEAELSHTISNVKEGAPAKHPLQRLLLPFFVLFLLVPGFLFFVGHVREGNNHNERTFWRDRNSSSRDGEELQAVIDVAGSGHLQSTVVVVNKPVEAAKCEGWRDWIDYESGWKGCVP